MTESKGVTLTDYSLCQSHKEKTFQEISIGFNKLEFIDTLGNCCLSDGNINEMIYIKPLEQQIAYFKDRGKSSSPDYGVKS